MNLGNIENVKLTSSSKTTILVSKLSSSPNHTNTLCMNTNIRIHYNRPKPFMSGEKIFDVYLYLTYWSLVENREAAIPANFTFTELKQNFTNRFWIDVNQDYEHPLLKSICECVKKNVDMESGTEIDCIFENPIQFQAQGNWINRGWGETASQYLSGIKLRRCR